MGKSQYIIQFGGLPVGVHEFEFEVKDKFFQEVENSAVSRANIHVTASLTKQNNLLQVDFHLKGTVGVECDRCVKEFDLPFETRDSLVVRHGDPEESNDEILVIAEGETEFEVSQYIYEYIMLALPARRVPCETDKKAFECDKETLKRLNRVSAGAAKENSTMVNPLWEQLSKLKKDIKN